MHSASFPPSPGSAPSGSTTNCLTYGEVTPLMTFIFVVNTITSLYPLAQYPNQAVQFSPTNMHGMSNLSHVADTLSGLG